MQPLDSAGVYYAIATSGMYPGEGGTGLGSEYSGEIGLFAYPSTRLAQGIVLDGQALNQSEYPILYAMLGTRFGTGGGSTFKVPDLSGANPTLLGRASYTNGLTIYQVFNGSIPSLSSANAPIANYDAYATQAGSLNVTVTGLLANDNYASSVMVVKQPSHGTVTVNASGHFVYTANTTYQGANSFTYKAFNNWGSSMEATVSQLHQQWRDDGIVAKRGV
ncbi:Ig-like domain-containing protein [Paenibacillus cymbidii]|uniref:Ig-like domain-containing protein n=1 Tax=Paenibacillus cymbidii TaxID=1639034 RepID=UPI002E2537BD